MNARVMRRSQSALVLTMVIAITSHSLCWGHGTVVYPKSRVYRVYLSNPSNPNFQLASNAVAMDGSLSYYTWNEVSRNIPQALSAGLPPGFDYSPWVPDGQLASAGRVDPNSPLYPRTYGGLDQVSANWPTTPLVAGSTITVQFLVTAVHTPSVWDVWMTTPGWDPSTALSWNEMEYLSRPSPTLAGGQYSFNLTIPMNRSGHHVLWVAWQRNDPAGEVFFSACDIDISNSFNLSMTSSGGGDLNLQLLGIPGAAVEGYTLFSLDTSSPVGAGSLLGLSPDWLTYTGLASPAASGNPLHFLAPYSAGSYPASPFSLPPGSLPSFSGLSVDAMVGVLDSSANLLAVTNVSRATL